MFIFFHFVLNLQDDETLSIFQSQQEVTDFDALMNWLENAADTLNIVDSPVHDLSQEYEVTITRINSVKDNGNIWCEQGLNCFFLLHMSHLLNCCSNFAYSKSSCVSARQRTIG